MENFAIPTLRTIRSLLADRSFLDRHRISPKAFTRNRKLPFSLVVLLVLQKTVKSLQLHLHEFFAGLGDGFGGDPATAGAWTQQRAKLRHTAFVELNKVAVLEPLENAPNALALWRGHRLLAIDGSLLRLPNSEEVWKEYGGQQSSNQYGPCGARVPQARLSVLFDVLNRIGLDTRICGFSTGETVLAHAHLETLRGGDATLLDRGYSGYELFARILGRGAHFVGRCQRRSFSAVSALFVRDEAGVDTTVTLVAPAEAIAAGLPATMRVRLLTLRLPTGELEVLATSLLDGDAYPSSEFLWLYGQRWGIETYYGTLKGRLDLENFSGKSVEAVLQDLHAAVFLCNLESILTAKVAKTMPAAGENGRKHAAQINRAVSFHAIKSRIFDLLLGTSPLEEVLAEIEKLFAANSVCVRPGRNPTRRKPTPLRSHNFFKRVRKIVF